MTGAVPSREILLDRYAGVTDWYRTGGNASAEYVALIDALRPIIERVGGERMPDPTEHPDGQVVDELVERLGGLMADVVLHRCYVASSGSFTGTPEELAELDRTGYGAIADPILVALDKGVARVDCRAATWTPISYDPKQCTRPASFNRDGLPVCVMHSKGTRVYPFVR